MLTKEEVRGKYQANAQHYDRAVSLYRLIGIRSHEYRTSAIDLLRLKPGSRVVDLGCGTGLSFPLIQDRIGPEGRLIGVDLTLAMLDQARKRVERHGWRNVELVQADASMYKLPEGVDGVVSVGLFGYLSDYDEVIRRAAQALSPGGRLVILDGKVPDGVFAGALLKFALTVGRPFGVKLDYADRRPWESFPKYLDESSLEERFFGGMYIASGSSRRSD